MIILDTNVISEIMRPQPSLQVIAWLKSLPMESVYLTSITAGELWYGVHLLPAGQRRSGLELRIRATLDEDFRDRVLGFDKPAAEVYGRLLAQQKRRGRTNDGADTQIAAIATIRNFAVATRNVEDFELSGVKLINPWTD